MVTVAKEEAMVRIRTEETPAPAAQLRAAIKGVQLLLDRTGGADRELQQVLALLWSALDRLEALNLRSASAPSVRA